MEQEVYITGGQRSASNGIEGTGAFVDWPFGLPALVVHECSRYEPITVRQVYMDLSPRVCAQLISELYKAMRECQARKGQYPRENSDVVEYTVSVYYKDGFSICMAYATLEEAQEYIGKVLGEDVTCSIEKVSLDEIERSE